MSDTLFNTAPPKTLSPEQMDRFRREGYVIIEKLCAQDEIDRSRSISNYVHHRLPTLVLW